MNPKLKNLFFFFYLLAACLILLEAALRISGFNPQYAAVEVYHLDDHLLYRMKPRCLPDINEYGYRGAWPTGSAKRVVFLGDSMTFGQGVPADSTIPAVLGERLGGQYAVYNLGVKGYGPDQELEVLKRVGLKLKPEIAIVGIFPGNDYRDLQKNEIYRFDAASGKAVRNSTNFIKRNLSPLWIVRYIDFLIYKNPWRENAFLKKAVYDRYDSIFRDFWWTGLDYGFQTDPNTPEARAKVAMMEAVLADWKKICEEGKIKLLVVVYPFHPSLEAGNDNLERPVHGICERLSIPYINLFRPMEQSGRGFREYYQEDQHFTAQGCRAVARYIAEQLKKLQYV